MTKLLDTTLRDGSYVIDFQFTPKDTAIIGYALDKAGVDFIELGHGLGLNAGTMPHMKSPASDELYLEAAANSIKTSKWGMFFIPNIGRLEDIDLAAKYKMDFIRIGTDVTNSEMAGKYIEQAKKHGMYVAANFMKTYAVSAKEVGQRAKVAQEFGADIVCIVDSAGGMLPNDVDLYFNAIREKCDVPIGFHGHNNLGFAMANTLRAVDLGCEVVDTSIRGMGRSAGNAVTEMLLFTMDRIGKALDVKIYDILKIAEELIDPLLKNYQQVDSIGIVSGYAQFHSSYLGKIYQFASEYNVDPKKLIVDVSKVEKVTVTDDIVKMQAKRIKESHTTGAPASHGFSIPFYQYSTTQGSFGQQLQKVLDNARSVSKRYGNKIVLNIVQATGNHSGSVSQVINEGTAYTVVSAEIANIEQCKTILEVGKLNVDHFLLDCDEKSLGSRDLIQEFESLPAEKVIRYSDTEIWAKAIVSLILDNKLSITTFWGHGNSLLQQNTQRMLANFGYTLQDLADLSADVADDVMVIAFEELKNSDLKHIKKAAVIVDAIVGSIEASLLSRLTEKGTKVIRPHMHSFILGETESRLASNQIHKSIMGCGKINDIPVASGGFVAAKGTVIVDDVQNPKKIYGIANGMGFLLKPQMLSDSEQNSIKVLENFISLKFIESE